MHRLPLEKSSAHTGVVLALCATFVFVISHPAAANTLCVNPSGTHGCYSHIQNAVNHAAVNDVIDVEPGIYAEEVDIGIPLSLIGEGAMPRTSPMASLSTDLTLPAFTM